MEKTRMREGGREKRSNGSTKSGTYTYSIKQLLACQLARPYPASLVLSRCWSLDDPGSSSTLLISWT